MKHKKIGELTVAPSSANVDKANVGDFVSWNNELYVCTNETIGSAVFVNLKTISDYFIDNIKLAQAPSKTFKGNPTNLTANIIDIPYIEYPVQNALNGNATLIAGTVTIINASITTNSKALIGITTIGSITDTPIRYIANNGNMVFSTGVGTDNATFTYLIII